MSKKWTFGLIMAAMIWGLTGCSGSSGEEESGDCTSMTLHQTTAHPMDWVQITIGEGSEIDSDDLLTEVFVDGVDPFVTVSGLDEDDNIWVFVPAHPDGIDGGVMELQIYSGEVECPAQQLTVAPLDEAPGAFAELIDEYERLLQTEATRLDADLQQLSELVDPNTAVDLPAIPANHLALAKAYWILSHPEHPNSLRAMADGNAPVMADDDGPLDFALAEALIAHSGVVDAVAQHVDELQTAPLPQIDWVPVDSGGGPGANMSSIDGLFMANIGSTERLSELMKEGALSCRMLDDPSLKNVNTAIGIIGAFPNLLTQAGGAAYGMQMTFLLETSRAKCGLLPSKLENFRPGVDEIEIEEDRPRLDFDTMYTDASSDQWELTETAAEVALQIISTLLADVRVGQVGWEKAGRWQEFFLKYGINLLQEWAFEMLSENKELLNDLVEGTTIGPFQWSDFPMSSIDWVYITSVITEQVNPGLAVAPLRIAESTVTIEARTDKFPPDGAREQVPGAVLPIDIEIPDYMLVAPGETIELEFTVANAYDPSLSWSNDSSMPGPYVAGSFQQTTHAATGTVYFETPADDSEFPVIITAESTSTSGLLHPDNDPDPPLARTILVTGNAMIWPPSACVPPGETHVFQVYTHQADAEVSWHPSNRMTTVDDTTALYTAPSTEGREEITVEVTYQSGELDQSTFEDTAVVNIHDCTCWWEISFGGNSFSGESIMDPVHSDDTTALAIGQTSDSDDSEGGSVVIEAPYGAVGPVSGSVTVTNNSGIVWGAEGEDLRIHLAAHTPEEIRADMTGVLTEFSTAGEGPSFPFTGSIAWTADGDCYIDLGF